jgi:hypothetical protein
MKRPAPSPYGRPRIRREKGAAIAGIIVAAIGDAAREMMSLRSGRTDASDM